MFQAAATFGAGILAGQGLGACRESLPGCRIRDPGEDAGTSFRLSVHVLGARSAELARPGLVRRPELRVEVLFGQTQKETEAAVFAGDAAAATPQLDGAAAAGWAALGCTSGDGEGRDGRSAASGGAPAADAAAAALGAAGAAAEDDERCPWRFDDTVTFAARPCDVLREGIRLRLGARSDVCLGPLQVRLPRVQDLGEGVLELRRAVLAACRPAAAPDAGHGAGGSSGGPAAAPRRVWRTPVLVVPLTRVADGPAGGLSLPVVSRVSLTCSVNMDPEVLLREAALADRSLMDKVVDPMVQCIEAPACAALPFCGAGRLAAACRARSPRSYGTPPRASGAGAVAGAAAGGAYATCEVPAVLVRGGALPEEEAEDGFQQPSLNGLAGLWPAHGAGLGAESPWRPVRFSSAAPEAGAPGAGPDAGGAGGARPPSRWAAADAPALRGERLSTVGLLAMSPPPPGAAPGAGVRAPR